MGIGEFIDGIVPQGSTLGLIILLVCIGGVLIIVFGGIAFVVFNKRRWNLKVEIKLPRSDGNIVNGEWAKGYFDSKRGVVFIKRTGFWQKKIPLKIFDPKVYLQGGDLLTVIQLSPTDYRPVLPESYLKVTSEYEKENGETVTVEEAIINIKCDTGHDKAWRTSFEAAAKNAYSLQTFFQQFQTPIAIGIVVVCCFVGIAALWTQMPGS